MAFTVNLKPLEELKNRYSSARFNKAVLSEIGISIRGINKELENAVKKRYAHPNLLGSVLQNRSISNVKLARNNLVTASLIYLFKPVPLSDFPVTETEVSASTKYKMRIPGPRGGKGKVVTRGRKTVLQLQVKVLRRGNYKVPFRNYKGFLIKPTRSAHGKYTGISKPTGRRGVYQRLQKRTFNKKLFERAPIKPLFGISLSQSAAYVFNHKLIDLDKIAKKTFDSVVLKF